MLDITIAILIGFIIILSIIAVILLSKIIFDTFTINSYKAININSVIKDCIDFIKAVYNMETR